MKKRLLVILGLGLVSGILMTGCAKSSESNPSAAPAASARESSSEDGGASEQQEENISEDTIDGTESAAGNGASELTARFGYEGETFTLHLYDNDTAVAIARHVGTSDWNLPIYHYDDYDNWEVMQYYDIPKRYEIPSASQEITEEKAGEVYYSEPNRIILYYQDAQVPAQYTPVGYFDPTEELVDAVENNPVLEGWGNKIITISDGE